MLTRPLLFCLLIGPAMAQAECTSYNANTNTITIRTHNPNATCAPIEAPSKNNPEADAARSADPKTADKLRKFSDLRHQANHLANRPTRSYYGQKQF